MKIGNIQFPDRPLFLAPMEDVTDIGFRMLCKRFGAQMVYTEFVSAEALIRSIKSTVNKLNIADEERPVGIQIYGRDTEAVVEAAKIVEDQAHPDVIDLNFGCPVKKVAGKGAGAGMLQNLPKLLDITKQVVDAVKTPVTVKTRLGWNAEDLTFSRLNPESGRAQIIDLAEALQDCGSIEDANKAFDTYGVDAVMIGRATFGCPWLFSPTPLTLDEKIDTLLEQLHINVERLDEKRGILHTRRHLAASPLFKGIPDFRQTRIAMLRAETVEGLTKIIEDTRIMLKDMESQDRQ